MPYKDPEKQRAYFQAYEVDPERKRKSRARKQTPKYKAKQSLWLKNIRSTPEGSKRLSEMKKRWEASQKGVEAARARNLRRAGWTKERFEIAWAKQNNICPTCGVTMTRASPHRKSNEATPDHCHDTGKARALLCQRCNKMEGIIKKYAKIFQDYAAEWAAIHAAEEQDAAE